MQPCVVNLGHHHWIIRSSLTGSIDAVETAVVHRMHRQRAAVAAWCVMPPGPYQASPELIPKEGSPPSFDIA